MVAITHSRLKYHYLFFQIKELVYYCFLLFIYYCLLFRFTCFSCGTYTEVHFEQIVNFETLKFI